MTKTTQHIVVTTQWVIAAAATYFVVRSVMAEESIAVLMSLPGLFLLFILFAVINILISVFIYKGKGLLSQKKL